MGKWGCGNASRADAVWKRKYQERAKECERKVMNHPAKFTDAFFEVFSEMLNGCSSVFDPFAGTGKIGKLKQYGFTGEIYANEIEPEWLSPNEHMCDVLTFCDAEFLDYPESHFDAICTSPTYGNRMADHHNAKDRSKRNTYTHCLGHQLAQGNTGKMQWGQEYREKHERVYRHIAKMVKPGGKFVLNIKNHIRRGVEIDVVAFHEATLKNCGFEMIDKRAIETPSLKYGANADKRLPIEYIILFRKDDSE